MWVYTGRSVRAVLDALIDDSADPELIQLAVLVERGVPRAADSKRIMLVKNVMTAKSEKLRCI